MRLRCRKNMLNVKLSRVATLNKAKGGTFLGAPRLCEQGSAFNESVSLRFSRLRLELTTFNLREHSFIACRDFNF